MARITNRDWTTSTLGDRVRYALDRAGFGEDGQQRAFARKAGLESPTLSRWVTDDVPGFTKRGFEEGTKIADAAGVDVRWLMSGLGQPDALPSHTPPHGLDLSVAWVESRRTAAAVMRGAFDPQAIEGMMTAVFMPQPGMSPDVDPGPEFFMKMVRDLHVARHKYIEMKESEPPMQPRPKPAKRK